MSDHTPDDEQHQEPHFVQPVGASEAGSATEDQLEAYDVDHDGKISILENERARLGIVDAKLEELSEHDGITGAVAKAAHKIVDRLDND